MSKKKTEETVLADEMLGKSEAFVIKHKKKITTVVTILAVCVLGYFGYQKFIAEPEEAEAKAALNEPMYLAMNGDNATALEGFRSINEQYSGTKAGEIAKIMTAGLAAAVEDNYEEAIQLFEEYDGDDDIFAPHVKHALGNCYAHTGDTETAIELILEAAEEANNEAVTPLCWRDVAAMYEQQGKSAEAKELYERIKKEYPETPIVMYGEIDKQLNSVK